jgi:hypothetical protein
MVDSFLAYLKIALNESFSLADERFSSLAASAYFSSDLVRLAKYVDSEFSSGSANDKA